VKVGFAPSSVFSSSRESQSINKGNSTKKSKLYTIKIETNGRITFAKFILGHHFVLASVLHIDTLDFHHRPIGVRFLGVECRREAAHQFDGIAIVIPLDGGLGIRNDETFKVEQTALLRLPYGGLLLECGRNAVSLTATRDEKMQN